MEYIKEYGCFLEALRIVGKKESPKKVFMEDSFIKTKISPSFKPQDKKLILEEKDINHILNQLLQNLEINELIIEKNAYINDDIDIRIPFLSNVTSINLTVCIGDEEPVEFAVLILKLCYNVKDLKLEFSEYGIKRLNLLIDQIVSLKKLKSLIVLNEGYATPHPNIFNDDDIAKIINSSLSLQELKIVDCCPISGDFFKMLKENNTLRILDIKRAVFSSISIVEESQDYYLQNHLYKLNELYLKNYSNLQFLKSLSDFCPNLKYLDLDYQYREISDEDKEKEDKFLVELFQAGAFKNIEKFYHPSLSSNLSKLKNRNIQNKIDVFINE